MKRDLTELVFILDKSGSMGGLEADTIGGYNALLKKQQAIDKPCIVTTVLFDNAYEVLHDRIDLNAINPLTDQHYQVGGSTALLDAIGKTIYKLITVQKNTKKDYQADSVMFVIMSDGEENASHEFSSQHIKQLIHQQTTNYGWEFIFLGANMDAVKTAEDYGINELNAQKFSADEKGIELSYRVMGEAVANYRLNACMAKDWAKDIQNDQVHRAKKTR